MKKRIKVQGTLIFAGFILFVLLSQYMFQTWRSAALDALMDGIGFGVFFLGFLFRISARGYKSERSAGSNKLVTHGPYGFVRNPMYFGSFLIGTGVICVLCQGWVFLAFLAVFLSIYIPQTRLEEKLLLERFGAEYAAYCKRTPRFFPDPRRLFKPDAERSLPLKRPWIKNEISSLLANIAAISLLELWEDARLFGRAYAAREALGLFLMAGSFFIILMFFTRGTRNA